MILSFYIDIRDVDEDGIHQYLDQVKQAMSHQIGEQGSNDVVAFFVPIKGESRIECVNPVLVTEQEAIDRFNKSMEKLSELNFNLEQKFVNKKEDEKTEE